MPILLRLLAWTLLLALVQIFVAAGAKRQHDGLQWAAGARDKPPPDYPGIAGRLHRAQLNLFETLPLFAAAVLAAQLSGRTGSVAVLGAAIYLGARIVYLPLYASGVALLRSVVWGVSVGGLLMVLLALLV